MVWIFAQSPSCDYIFKDCEKTEVYIFRQATVEESKNAIHQKVADIPSDKILHVMEGFKYHPKEWIANWGSYLEDVSFLNEMNKNSSLLFILWNTFFYISYFGILVIL